MERLKAILTEIVVIIVILFITSIAALVDLRLKDSNLTSDTIGDMQMSLEQEKKEITYLGDTIKKEGEELRNLKDKMNSIKLEGGDEWNNLVVEYNSKLNEYNKKTKEYNERVKSYDKKYEQYEKAKQKNESVIKWFKTLIGTE
ncbi:hypothetical protein [Clostridium sp.]|jgi:chromosome segregation ATPase|uniref:hypothetical protein n=1 Tax=Clostridium sp. TaxID=1506 RepID=UPI002FDCF91F